MRGLVMRTAMMRSLVRRLPWVVSLVLAGAILGCSGPSAKKSAFVEVPEALKEGGDISPESAQRLQDACQAGDLAMCQRWLRVLRLGCEGGRSDACLILAGYSLRGLSVAGTEVVERDPEKAVTILQRHCDLGNRPGCEALAALYYKGVGVPQNVQRAADLLCGGGAMTKLPVSLSKECAAGGSGACGVLERCCAMGNAGACGAHKATQGPPSERSTNAGAMPGKSAGSR
jgi:hypothetical protein